MKKLIIFAVLFASCQPDHVTYVDQTPNPVQDYGNYQVVNNPNGQQVVVVKDNSGAEFLMEYLMFQQLLNMAGGMNNVWGYRQQHQYDDDWNIRQASYRNVTTTTINNYYGNDHKVDASKPISEQVKYNESKGFGKKTQPVNYQPSSGFGKTSQPSKGFTGSGSNVKVETTTPKPVYQPSSGFKSNPSTSTSSSYKPSSGFGTKPSYKPSSGFGSKPTYSGSKGFGKKN